MAQDRHVVFLLHGIRTQAEWSQQVAAILEETPGVRVIPIRYEYFDVLRFLIPVRAIRERPVARIARAFRDELSRGKPPMISVIAHSFGSYCFSRLLESEPDIRFHRLILCGSVVPDSFDWGRFGHRFSNDSEGDWQILNDCGMRDILPVFAKSITWGYGASGRFGFGNPRVKDRYFEIGHSGFFDPDFVRKFWLPYMSEGKIVGGVLKRPTTPLWVSLLTVFKARTFIILALLGTSLWLWERQWPGGSGRFLARFQSPPNSAPASPAGLNAGDAVPPTADPRPPSSAPQAPTAGSPAAMASASPPPSAPPLTSLEPPASSSMSSKAAPGSQLPQRSSDGPLKGSEPPVATESKAKPATKPTPTGIIFLTGVQLGMSKSAFEEAIKEFKRTERHGIIPNVYYFAHSYAGFDGNTIVRIARNKVDSVEWTSKIDYERVETQMPDGRPPLISKTGPANSLDEQKEKCEAFLSQIQATLGRALGRPPGGFNDDRANRSLSTWTRLRSERLQRLATFPANGQFAETDLRWNGRLEAWRDDHWERHLEFGDCRVILTVAQ